MNTTTNPLVQLPQPLLTWYRANARDLPWRQTTDPYRIWVSEIMLQQTRVAAVLGYYARFLEAFPTAADLAAAPEDRLMRCWQGLGYYSRARNMQKAAQLVVDRYGGHLPETYAELLALPGIGDYTASAIASAAFGVREAAVDGNVLRVVSRLTDCHDDILLPQTKKRVRDALSAVMPTSGADIQVFNQATMELGATVCIPKGPPQCAVCPAQSFCLGYRRGTAEKLPMRTPKRPRQVQELTVYLLEREGRIALRRRSNTGLLAGLWEFPNVPGTLTEAEATGPVESWGLTATAWREKLTARHIFTHREWHMTGYCLQVTGDGPKDFLWADATDLSRCAIPSAFARYRDEAEALFHREWE